MNIEQYCNITDNLLRFSRKQASQFAKEVADDFNPIHDIEAKRFCVPGDLLFAILLTRYGVARSTHVDFSGMVGDGVSIELPDSVESSYRLIDVREREYLEITYEGERWQEKQAVDSVITEYVTFSGKTFPDVLVELMKKENVMINADRPLVIYKSMGISFDDAVSATDLTSSLQLTLDTATLSVDGKKGQADLGFSFSSDGKKIGEGHKVMLLSGLKEYDDAVMQDIVQQYAQWKTDYEPA